MFVGLLSSGLPPCCLLVFLFFLRLRTDGRQRSELFQKGLLLDLQMLCLGVLVGLGVLLDSRLEDLFERLVGLAERLTRFLDGHTFRQRALLFEVIFLLGGAQEGLAVAFLPSFVDLCLELRRDVLLCFLHARPIGRLRRLQPGSCRVLLVLDGRAARVTAERGRTKKNGCLKRASHGTFLSSRVPCLGVRPVYPQKKQEKERCLLSSRLKIFLVLS